MTMTSSAFHEVGWVCPEVADETNPRVKPSPISWTHVNWGGLLDDCGSGASRVFSCGISSVVFGYIGSAMNEAAPGWTVGSKVLPGLSVY